MSYFQANKKWLIDRKSWQLVGVEDRVKPAVIDTPFYLWNFAESSRHFVAYGLSGETCQFKKTSQVRLNNLVVKFHQGHRKCCVQFMERGVWRKIEVRSSYWTQYHIQNGNVPAGGEYKIIYDGEERNFRTNFNTGNVRFFDVGDLDVRQFLDSSLDRICLGIHHLPFEIYYRDKKLSGKSYVLLCGHWGILLSDTFEFDSLALFAGVMPGTIWVDKFAYTVNPYVVKVSFLNR